MRIFTLVLSIVLFHNISFAKWTIYDSTDVDPSGRLKYMNRFLYIDNTDNIWILANNADELIKFNEQSTVFFDTSNTNLPFMQISCATQGPNGDMYFGTYEDYTSPNMASLIRYDGENWESFNQFNSPMLPYGIHDILVTGEDEFWSANVIGLYHYKKGKWNSYFEDENLYRRDINKLAIDKNNNLYIANNYRELYSADLNKANIKFNKVAVPPFQGVGLLTCDVDSSNNIWLYYTGTGSLYKKEGNNWKNYDTLGRALVTRDKKLYSQSLRNIYEYKENSYWEKILVTPDSVLGGLISLKAKDSKGNFWFTSGNKLVKYTPETNSVKKEINVKIYPNPSQNTIIINAEEPLTKLTLYSMNLSKISEYPANHTTTQEVDISTVPSGIYFIKVNDELIKFVRE